MNQITAAFVKFRALFAGLWRLGLIKRTTAFRWEVSVAVLLALIALMPVMAHAQDAAAAPAPAPLATVSGTAADPSPAVSAPATPLQQAAAALAPALTPAEAALVAAGAADAQKVAGLAQEAVRALPSGPWNGRLDRSLSDFRLGGWQSLKSLDQAYGVSKPVWALNKGDEPLLNFGLFAGVKKPLDPLVSSSPRFLAGETVAIPGHAFDWALGTNMGSYWLPKAKAGILIAHDWTRPSQLKLCPDFVGVGLTYGFGAPAK